MLLTVSPYLTLVYYATGMANRKTPFLAARNRCTLHLSWQHYGHLRLRVAEAASFANIILTAYHVCVSEIYFVQNYL